MTTRTIKNQEQFTFSMDGEVWMQYTKHNFRHPLFVSSMGRVYYPHRWGYYIGGGHMPGAVTTPSVKRQLRNGRVQYVMVARMVAELFLNDHPTPFQRFIRHLDGDPTNNDVKNLSWSKYRRMPERKGKGNRLISYRRKAAEKALEHIRKEVAQAGEIWRECINPNLKAPLFVSNMGRVYNAGAQKGEEMKVLRNRKGEATVRVGYKKVPTEYMVLTVRQLIKQLFIG